MMPSQKYAQSIKSGLELPWWFTNQHPPVNADFEQRVVSLPQHAHWHSTQLSGIEIRVLEHVPGEKARLTAQLRLASDFSPARLGDNPDLEILMQRGELVSAIGVYPAGLYLRLPVTGDSHLQALTLQCAPVAANTTNPLQRAVDAGEQVLTPKAVVSQNAGVEPALLYLAAGQMLTTDTEQRRLDTNDDSRWLPGPVSGTEVLPLHGHGTANVMLIRWLDQVAFKPGLDPMGEEVLVLNGMLHDAQSTYPAGSWIRNPIAAWQSWAGKAGTVVYYKNGHFASPTDLT